MLHIYNKTILNKKSILYELTTLYGINRAESKKICSIFGINPLTKINNLKKRLLRKITNHIYKNLKIEHKLKSLKDKRIQFLLSISCKRAIRYSVGLPVRGQRTRTNASTSKKLRYKYYKNEITKNKTKSLR